MSHAEAIKKMLDETYPVDPHEIKIYKSRHTNSGIVVMTFAEERAFLSEGNIRWMIRELQKYLPEANPEEKSDEK